MQKYAYIPELQVQVQRLYFGKIIQEIGDFLLLFFYFIKNLIA